MEIEPVPWSFTIEFDEGKERIGGFDVLRRYAPHRLPTGR